jgi:hypothetical protein
MPPPSRHVLSIVLLVCALAGCSRSESPAPVSAAAHPAAIGAQKPALDDDLSVILPDLMELLVDPAAGVLFAAAGQPARSDLEPRTQEAWQAVGEAAAQLMQTSDMLVQPALARGRADWLQWAAVLREGAVTAGAAARRHDPRSLFAAGMQAQTSCQACHARYAPQLAEAPALSAPR